MAGSDVAEEFFICAGLVVDEPGGVVVLLLCLPCVRVVTGE